MAAFFNVCTNSQLTKTVVVKRFDKLFMNMSSALLAVLRDLELKGSLVAVNTSVLKYADLYDRRAKRDPTFVSDYGTSHAKLMVGPLGSEAAWEEWQRGVSGSGDDRRDKAYFSVAYEFSAGLPALFRAATAYVGESLKNGDLREYKRLLSDHLRPEFARLLKYDQDDTGAFALAESLARIYWEIPSDLDRERVLGYRWGELLVRADDTHRLTSPLIGSCAVDILRHSGRLTDPESFYRRGEFEACAQILRKTGTSSALLFAAELMSEAFGQDIEPLYFADDVNWKRVDNFANQGLRVAKEPASADEFRNWARVAHAMQTFADISLSMEARLVQIGLRILAVRSDRNPVTAAYAAIPLVENALKTYITYACKTVPEASAFDSLSDSEVSNWWRRGASAFVRPQDSQPLSTASLVLLAAVLSARRGARLFSDPNDVSQSIDMLDQRRNRLGHKIEAPDRIFSRELADCSERIIDAAAALENSDFSVKSLARWVTPPHSVLTKG